MTSQSIQRGRSGGGNLCLEAVQHMCAQGKDAGDGRPQTWQEKKRFIHIFWV